MSSSGFANHNLWAPLLSFGNPNGSMSEISHEQKPNEQSEQMALEEQDDQEGFVESKVKKERINLITAYQEKVQKLNYLTEGKRYVRKSKQTGYLPKGVFDYQLNVNYMFELFGGVVIPCDFEYREQSVVSVNTNKQVYCEQNFVQKRIVFNKVLNCVEICMNNYRCGINQFQFVYEFLIKQGNRYLKELADVLMKYQEEVNLIMSKSKMFQNLTSKIYQEMEEDYQSFIQYVKEVASKMERNTFFKITIGKMNYLMGDIDITFLSFSTEYLHLIGINQEMMEYAYMREGRIIMDCSFEESLYLTKSGIIFRIDCNPDNLKFNYDITTFDGFKLYVECTVNKIQSPFNRHIQTPYDHIGYIDQIYVHPNQLEALRLYRQNLANKHNCSSFDQYVKIELSNFFQSVEYSVYSEMFIDKYYKDTNIQDK